MFFFFYYLFRNLKSDVYLIYLLIFIKFFFFFIYEFQNFFCYDISSELVIWKGSVGELLLCYRWLSFGSCLDKEIEYNCGMMNVDILFMDNNVVQSINIMVVCYRGCMVVIKLFRKKKLKMDGVKFLKEMKQVWFCLLKGFVFVVQFVYIFVIKLIKIYDKRFLVGLLCFLNVYL